MALLQGLFYFQNFPKGLFTSKLQYAIILTDKEFFIVNSFMNIYIFLYINMLNVF